MNLLFIAKITDLGSVAEIAGQLTDEIKNNNKLIIFLTVVMIFDILVVAAKLISDFTLKNLDKKIHGANARENKRIDIYEKIYLLMNELTFIEGRESEKIINKVTEVERFLSANLIYISKDIEKAIFKFTDYNKSVATDYRKKNYATEKEILNLFKGYFNK